MRAPKPLATFYQGQLPPNVAAANTVRGNVQGGIYWTGTFRFSTEYFLVGPPNSSSCPGANYTTVGAALQAAAADDIILICPGTYNEALRIDKNVPYCWRAKESMARSNWLLNQSLICHRPSVIPRSSACPSSGCWRRVSPMRFTIPSVRCAWR